jgi:hypothetical protein
VKKERPLVSACVIGNDGDVTVVIYDDYCQIRLRNPHQEKDATVELGYSQAQVIRDVLDQMPPPLDDDDE